MAERPRAVLVADDSAVARFAVVRRVRAAGHEVVERDSAESAGSVDPSMLACALLDFDLGDGLGTDVAAHLRELASDLPIAFFTSSKPHDLDGRTASFGPVFAKPDDLDAALEWIDRATRR
jgi:CheY-like chemotaxis protein